ncbi:hypothetical protein DVH24_038104 [Malus domestica]|uniref:Uncharacterized protein n=1 Tax=Malus domestica TaxID=3750 RepID=A0A498K6K3_MALDO|nr:hypothetical protein DVH24_038104 [Malus domestica]
MKESETQDDEIEADEDGDDVTQKKKKQSKEVVTSEMVDSWCNAIKEHGKLSTSHSLMKRTMSLWASIHLCLEVKDEKAMKMAPGTRKALLSLVRPGYQD